MLIERNQFFATRSSKDPEAYRYTLKTYIGDLDARYERKKNIFIYRTASGRVTFAFIETMPPSRLCSHLRCTLSELNLAFFCRLNRVLTVPCSVRSILRFFFSPTCQLSNKARLLLIGCANPRRLFREDKDRCSVCYNSFMHFSVHVNHLNTALNSDQ